MWTISSVLRAFVFGDGGAAAEPLNKYACSTYAEAAALLESEEMLAELCAHLLSQTTSPDDGDDLEGIPTASAGASAASPLQERQQRRRQQCGAAVSLSQALRLAGSEYIGLEGVPTSLAPALKNYIEQECEYLIEMARTSATTATATATAPVTTASAPPPASTMGVVGLAAAVAACGSLSGITHGGGQREKYTEFGKMRQQLVSCNIHTVLSRLLQCINSSPNGGGGGRSDGGGGGRASEVDSELRHSALLEEASKSAMLCLRNIARDAAHRKLLADAGIIPLLLSQLSSTATASSAGGAGREADGGIMGGGGGGGAGAGVEEAEGGSKLARAAPNDTAVMSIEVMINLACLFENKQTLVDAGASSILVQCLKLQDLAVQEATLACMGCLTFFFTPAADALLADGVLSSVAQVLATALPLVGVSAGAAEGGTENSEAGGASAGGGAGAKAKATVVSATDLIKNLMLVPSARVAVLDAGRLAEHLMACVGASAEVPTDARSAALQALRMMCEEEDLDAVDNATLPAEGATASTAPVGGSSAEAATASAPRPSQGASSTFILPNMRRNVRSELDSRGFRDALMRCIAVEATAQRVKQTSLNINTVQPDNLAKIATSLLGTCVPIMTASVGGLPN